MEIMLNKSVHQYTTYIINIDVKQYYLDFITADYYHNVVIR